MARPTAAAESTTTPAAPETLRFINYTDETVHVRLPDDQLNLKPLRPGETIELTERVAALYPNFLAPAVDAAPAA